MTIKTGIGLLLLTSSLAWSQASINESNETSSLYVDTVHGSDSNSGTQQKPFKTLNKAVQTAASQATKGAGTKVTVLPGTYREAIAVDGSSSAPVTIEAATAGTAIVSGADVWTGWAVYSGNASVYTHYWPYTWGYCAQLAGPTEQRIVRRREQIFVNGFHLTQVLALSEMTVGTFFVNESSATVYIWPPSGTSMSTATVEVSTRPILFQITGLHDWVLRGLTFQEGNGCRQIEPAVKVGGGSASDILIDTDKFLWNNAAGLSVNTASYVTVNSSTANHNGESGMLGQYVANGLWSSDEGAYNNWRGAQGAYYAWQSEGGKFFSIHGGNYQNFKALYNQGGGIHFDTDNMDITVDSLMSAYNLGSGAQVEASQGPATFSGANICSNNSQVQPYAGGVNLCDAAYVTLNDSTLDNNGTSQIIITGQTGGMSVENYQTKATTQVYNQNLTVDSDTILATGSQEVFRDSYLSKDWPKFVDSLNSNYNTWWNANSSSPFTIPTSRANLTFSAWKTATGKDSNSAFAATSESCSVTPDTPDYWFLVNSGSNTISPGARSAFVLTAVPLGFSGTISLKADVTQVPDASASWTTTSIGSSGSATLTVSTSSATPAGTYPVTMIANSGNVTHTVTVSLVVN